MEETSHSSPNETLKSNFVSAANQITQLYTQAINLQKKSYERGHNYAIKDVISWVTKNSGQDRKISADSLLNFLKQKLEESQIDEEIPNPIEFQQHEPSRQPSSGTQQNSFVNFGNRPNPFVFNGLNEHGQTNSSTQQEFFQFGASQPSFQPQQPFTSNENHHQNGELKKRPFEAPSSMDLTYAYPEQSQKRSKTRRGTT